MQTSTQALAKGFAEARTIVGGFESAISQVRGVVQGVMGSAVGVAFQHSIKLAEELRENVERLDVVFGDSTDTIVEGANKMADAFGTSKIAFTGAAQKLGGMFHAAGVGEESAAGMTEQLLTLTQAIANFSHIPFETALGKVRAGMAGRGRALGEYGIAINDSAVKNEALSSGLAQAGEKLSAAAKVQARFNILMREGAGVIGQMGDRANDRANAFAEFSGRLENIQEMFGEKLPVPVESFFAQLNVGLVAAQTAWQSWSNDIITGQNDITDWGQSSTTSMGMVQRAVGYLADGWQLVSAAFHGFQALVNLGLSEVIKGLGLIGKGIDWILEQLNMSTNTGAGAFLETWSEGLHDTGMAEIEGLKQEWAKPWASEGVNASFDAARKKLHEARSGMAQAAIGAVGPAGPKVAAASQKNPFGEAMVFGSKEAASTILRSRAGVGSDKDMAKVAANSEKQTALLTAIADHLENISDNTGDDVLETIGSL